MKIVIFTDLDGTLLNHDDYSYEEARPALERIGREKIPLVITTSKTRVEVEALQRDMGIREPFIVENGAAVFIPLGYPGFDTSGCEITPSYALLRMGRTYAEIRQFILEKAAAFAIRGFGDIRVEELCRLAGMSLGQAGLAKEREFTEPFMLPEEGDLQGLRDLALRWGFKVLKGGRFHHLVGMGQDKGEAVRSLMRLASPKGKVPFKSIGLGDALNDLPMLSQVDFPVLIPRPDGTYEDMNLPALRRASSPGARGWRESVESLLDEMRR